MKLKDLEPLTVVLCNTTGDLYTILSAGEDSVELRLDGGNTCPACGQLVSLVSCKLVNPNSSVGDHTKDYTVIFLHDS